MGVFIGLLKCESERISFFSGNQTVSSEECTRRDCLLVPAYIHHTHTHINLFRASLLIQWTLICGMALISSVSGITTTEQRTDVHTQHHQQHRHRQQHRQQQRPDNRDHRTLSDSPLGLFRTPALPKPFINISYLPLENVQQVSRFRSAIGHDFSDNTEHCRCQIFLHAAGLHAAVLRLQTFTTHTTCVPIPIPALPLPVLMRALI